MSNKKIEEWKDIPNYNGRYKVSNFGRVMSIKKNGNKIFLKECKDEKWGYLSVRIYNNSGKHTCLIHRLVAQAFIPNPNNYPQVNHKDENKENNCVDNLEWCTSSYNINYGCRNEKMASKVRKKVARYNTKFELLEVYDSIANARKSGNFNCGSISACCLGKMKTHHGFVWRYFYE